MVVPMALWYLVWIIAMGIGLGVGIFLGGVNVVTLLDMMPWLLSLLALLLYVCKVGTQMGFKLYWFGAFVMIYLLSGTICVTFCGGCHVAWNGVNNIVSSFSFLRCMSWDGYGEVILVGCQVIFTLCCVSGVCSDLGSWSGWVLFGCGTSVLKIVIFSATPWYSCSLGVVWE